MAAEGLERATAPAVAVAVIEAGRRSSFDSAAPSSCWSLFVLSRSARSSGSGRDRHRSVRIAALPVRALVGVLLVIAVIAALLRVSWPAAA